MCRSAGKCKECLIISGVRWGGISGLVLFFFCSGFGRVKVGFFWFACGVGLSLICLWSIGVAPVRGGHLLSLHAAKKVGKESGFKPLILKRVPWLGGDSGAINER
ncbi:hypothetical protein, partial [Paraburkholderia ribeironis]|uniref:hypothetical protein n=1 Tax=Paraburkholderia ribeironis TaxID=1247936 RepID=UPI001C3FA9EA